MLCKLIYFEKNLWFILRVYGFNHQKKCEVFYDILRGKVVMVISGKILHSGTNNEQKKV